MVDTAAPIIDVLNDRLRVLMKEHNVKAAPLARRAQLNESAVRDILRGRSRNPGIVTLQRIAGVLNLRPSALFESGQSWSVIGSVESDGVVSMAAADASLGAVENPFFYLRSEEFAALRVGSGSLKPVAFDGDFLIFDKNEKGVREEDMGRPCVCFLADGRTLVRVPNLSDKTGKYNIASIEPYGSSEKDVTIDRAVRVALTLPSEFAPELPTPTHASSDAVHAEQSGYDAR